MSVISIPFRIDSSSSGTADSSEEALKREILKNVPSVDQVVAQLKREERESLGLSLNKSESFDEGPLVRKAFKVRPCRRKSKVEKRLDRIREMRQDLERIDVNNPTCVKYLSAKPVFNLKLNLDIEKLRDQRVERLRQTARSITGDSSSATTRRRIEGYKPCLVTRPPSFSRSKSTTVKGEKPSKQLNKPPISAQSSRRSNNRQRSEKTLVIEPHFTDLGVTDIPGEHADEIVSDFLKMESAVSKRVAGMPRDEPKKLKLATLPRNIQYYIFCFLDCRQLTIGFSVCKVFKRLLMDAIRTIFQDEFGEWPSGVSKKTLLWVLRRLHEIDSKRAAELFFWSVARGYTKFVLRVVSGRNMPPMRGSINVTSKNDNMTALHIACKHKQLAVLQLLLTVKGLNVNKLTKSGKHAVIFCIEQNSPEVLDILLSRSDLQVNSIDQGGVSLLYHACTSGNLEIVEALLMSSADPNMNDKEFRTALYGACQFGHTAIVSSLLQHPKVNIELRSKSGKSPVFIASEMGHAEVVRLLLQAGANPRSETCRKKNSLYVAAELGHEDVCRVLLPYTTKEDLLRVAHFGTTPMFIAAKHQNSRIKNMFEAFCKSKEDSKVEETKTLSLRIPGTLIEVPVVDTGEKIKEKKKQTNSVVQKKAAKWKDKLPESLMQKAVDLFQAEYENEFPPATFLEVKQSPEEWNNWSVSTKDQTIRVTAQQARRFQEKQRNKVMNAKKRVNARLMAERKQLLVQKELIKCMRDRARTAALRVAAMNTTATSSGSSTTSELACDWIERGFSGSRPSVKKIVVMPKLHQTIVASLSKSREGSASPNYIRASSRSARASLTNLNQAYDRPMTTPTSATGSRQMNHDRRRIYMRGRLTNSKNERSEHIRGKFLDKKRTPTRKFGRVKNSRDYIKSSSKRAMDTRERSSEPQADSLLRKHSEMLSVEHRFSRQKSAPQFFHDRRNSDQRRKQAVNDFLEFNAFGDRISKRKKRNSSLQQKTLKKNKRLQSAYGILMGKSRTPTRKRLRKKCVLSARAANRKFH